MEVLIKINQKNEKYEKSNNDKIDVYELIKKLRTDDIECLTNYLKNIYKVFLNEYITQIYKLYKKLLKFINFYYIN